MIESAGFELVEPQGGYVPGKPRVGAYEFTGTARPC